MKAKRSKDHYGNEYKSISEMCRHYGIDKDKYARRKRNKWPLCWIVEKPVFFQVQDNIPFKRIPAFCEFYGISKDKLSKCITFNDVCDLVESKGYEVNRNIKPHNPIVYKGQEFYFFEDLINKSKTDSYALYKRFYSLKMPFCWALNRPAEFSVEKGLGFKYYSKFCDYYGLEPEELNRNCGTEEAIVKYMVKHNLIPDREHVHAGKQYIDHKQRHFISFTEMATFYGMSPSLLRKRLKTMPEIWALENPGVYKVDDSYESKQYKRFCDHYGINPNGRIKSCKTLEDIKAYVEKHRKDLAKKPAVKAETVSVSKAPAARTKKTTSCAPKAVKTKQAQRKKYVKLPCVDERGIKYSSFTMMCKAHNIAFSEARARYQAGLPVQWYLDSSSDFCMKDFLRKNKEVHSRKHIMPSEYQPKAKPVVDPKTGKWYATLADCSKATGVARGTMSKRLNRGLDIYGNPVTC